MLVKTIEIRPRFDEVDTMGYVYHANYISYFHQARTELMRTLGWSDKSLEQKGILMPVIEVKVNYKKPAGYDEPLYVSAQLKEIPETRVTYLFEVKNEQYEIVCCGHTIVVFVDKESRKPLWAPAFLCDALKKQISNN